MTQRSMKAADVTREGKIRAKNSVGQWMKGDVPNGRGIAQLCRALRCSADDLLGVEGDYVAVPIKQVAVDGIRATLENTGLATREIHFRKDWLTRHNRPHANIFGYEVDPGAALAPVEPGDVVLIDSKDTRPQRGPLFLVLVGTSASIAKLEPQPKGEIVVRPDGESITVKPVDLNSRVKIEGRVFWRGGRV